MNGECGPCLTIALDIQMKRPQAQWAAAIEAVESEHRECVREYLRSMAMRTRVIERLRASSTGSSHSTPAAKHTSSTSSLPPARTRSRHGPTR